MDIKFKELRKEDYKKAKAFAMEGMHLDWFSDNKYVSNIYGSYFWHTELNRATDVIAAYDGDRLLGVILAAVNGKKKARYSRAKALILKVAAFLEKHFAADIDYDNANEEMLSECMKHTNLDGEIIFLAVDPQTQGMGIGTKLLEELSRREKGKKLYLYTDDGCNYGFYEKKGFNREGERDVKYDNVKDPFTLKCFLYTKAL